MKKIVIIIFVFLLSACSSINEEELKEEIKSELLEESIFDPSLFNDHLIKLSEDITKYTVAIKVTLANDAIVLGTGIIYSKNNNQYDVLTNEHVVRYASKVEVFIPSKNLYIEASITNQDADVDLANLSISSLTELDVYTINEESSYSIGEFVLAVGTATDIDYSNSITLGIISRIDDGIIQHDAAINSGNSGGPLFNLHGDLIGINSSKINTTYVGNTNVFVEGVGFSICLENVIDFINSL